MQVIDLLFRQELNLRLHVIGDLAQTIRWIHASESRDPAPYLNGGEVILSTGTWYTGKESVSRFVKGLVDANVVALGFGIHSEMPAVPAELIYEANERKLTLFEIPSDVTFISLSKIFVEESMANHELPLRETAARNTELLGILQRRDGLEAMLRILSRDLPGGAAVLVGSKVLAHCVTKIISKDSPPVLADAAESINIPSNFIRYPFFAAPSTFTLAVENFGEPLTSEQKQVVDQVKSFIVIELQRLNSNQEVERKYAQEIFDFIEKSPGDILAITSRMRTFGMQPELAMVAVCIKMSEENEDESYGLVSNWVESQPGVGLVGIRHGDILALLPVRQGMSTGDLGEEIYSLLAGRGIVGVGSIVRDVGGVRESIIQSQHASNFAARSHRLGYSTYDDLASHLVLLATQSDIVLEHFETALLLPLITHDASRHSELVRTLERFLALNGQFQVAADDLHVHVNTLRQRLTRVEELTGRDISMMANRVDFWLALEARKLRHKYPNGGDMDIHP